MKARKILSLLLVLCMAFSLFAGATAARADGEVTKPAAPTIALWVEDVRYGQNVPITSSIAGATIHYTTDGSEPTAESQVYSSENDIILTAESTTVKAIVVVDGVASDVSARTFKVAKYALTLPDSVTNGTVTAVVVDDEDTAATSESQGPHTIQVSQGRTVRLTFTPTEGYRLSHVRFDYSPDFNKLWESELPGINELASSMKAGGTITFEFKMPRTTGVTVSAADFRTPAVMPDTDGEQCTVTSSLTGTYAKSLSYGEATLQQTVKVTAKKGYTAAVTFTDPDGVKQSKQSGETFTLLDGSTEIAVTVKAAEEILTIGSKAELLAFAASVNAGLDYAGKTVTLTENITLNDTDTWVPIGTSDRPFKGSFDGGNHTVSGLRVTDTSLLYSGFFGFVYEDDDKPVVIQNLTVEGNIAGGKNKATYIGGVAGYVGSKTYKETSPVIQNCTSRVNIQGNIGLYIGGITGTLHGGKVLSCVNYGDISVTAQNQGNSAGISNGGKLIQGCANYGSIMGYKAAGIATTAGAIVSCANHGSISNLSGSQGAQIGASGIAWDFDSVADCYNTGSITVESLVNKPRNSEAWVTGIAANVSQLYKTCQVSNCYNIGTLTKIGWSSRVTRYGEINATYDVGGNSYSGFKEVEYTGATVTNCYTSAQVEAGLTAAALNGESSEAWKDSTFYGRPILAWETEPERQECQATVSVSGAESYTVTVSPNADFSEPASGEGGIYTLLSGKYYYKVEAAGYVSVSGSFFVVDNPVNVTAELRAEARVIFNVSPVNAELVLKDNSNTVVPPVSSENGVHVYSLFAGDVYSYTASASGYASTGRQLQPMEDETVTVTLSSSGRPPEPETIKYVTGGDTVEEGGTYYIKSGATGTIYIETTEPVMLVGTGTAEAYKNLLIECCAYDKEDKLVGVDLTLQDVFIQNSSSSNLIYFCGEGNKLTFAGVCVLDHDINAGKYAMIYVGPEDRDGKNSLTISGGIAYLYSRNQGACIGGDTREVNGEIAIRDAELFIKNTKQGAAIGAGSNAKNAGDPGAIRIENSKLTMIANSRSAGIGGSAGSGGASAGSNVYVDANSTVTINVDYSGAAIGGGGYKDGNDSDGGTLYYSGGSIRAFLDTNAVNNVGWNATEAGVNGNEAITADVVNESGNPLYLLVFNTESVSGTTFTVKEGSTILYSGTTHRWRYINELYDKDKGEQVGITYTIDNWVELDDPNLYLYLTGEDHTLDVNGTEFAVTWNEEYESFSVTKLSGGGVVEPSRPAETTTELPFTDVDGHWALDAIRYAYENKLFNGVSDTEFAPNMPMTRGMLVTVLYRLEGEPAVTANAKFSDVAEDQWYAKAVAWAADNEIVKGYGETFGPNDLVTREQMATILLRYAVWKQYDTTAGGMALREYADYAEISGWATAALEWANAEGLILGRTETTIVPQGDATRAEVATILMRFIEKFAK